MMASTTDEKRKSPSQQPQLGLTLRELKLLRRMVDGATLRKCSTGPFYGSYYEVVNEAGQRVGSRVQLKVLKRAEDRGYIAYAEKAYRLTEAGRVAMQYINAEQQRRKL